MSKARTSLSRYPFSHRKEASLQGSGVAGYVYDQGGRIFVNPESTSIEHPFRGGSSTTASNLLPERAFTALSAAIPTGSTTSPDPFLSMFLRRKSVDSGHSSTATTFCLPFAIKRVSAPVPE